MSLSELYQELIVDHGRKPRNKGTVEDATHHADGYNPLCGDTVNLTLQVEDGIITDVKFEGHGCAISQASASLLTEEVRGKSVQEVAEIFKKFRTAMTTDEVADDLGSLEALVPVKEYPMRVKCATLSWHTLMQALGVSKDA